MRNSNRQYAVSLYTAIKEASPKDTSAVISNLVELLVKNRRLRQASRIIDEFVNYAKKQEGITDLVITSARKLDKKTIEEIEKVFGSKIASVQKVDPQLIGGVLVVKDRESIFDASIKMQVQEIKIILNK